MSGETESTQRHLERHRRLLQMEYLHEREEFRRHTEQVGVERMKAKGNAWWPLATGRRYHNSLNQLIIEVFRAEEEAEEEHAFEYGRPVSFFTVGADGSVKWLNFTATVSFADGNRMAVAMPTDGAATAVMQAEGKLGVQLAFDQTSYDAMFDALDRVSRATDCRLAQLRETLLGKAPARFREQEPVSMPWLNPSQQTAVGQVLCARDVAVVHGPPGTGKTTTLVEAIDETLRREPQVMVCAQSNAAVDWICEQLDARGLHVLRIGNPVRVDDKMLSHTYEHRFSDHPAYPELWAIRKEIRKLRSSRKERGRALASRRLDKLRERATELECRINADILQQAHVVASTLVSSTHRLLDSLRGVTLFIDEAAQALEAACWIPITRADRVIFAGDHCQLPPTVKCYEAMREGLAHTLMQTIAERQPDAVTLLTVQYRMHTEIMQFSSQEFYHGILTAAPEVAERTLLQCDAPITWIDTADLSAPEAETGANHGRINREEGRLLLETLRAYVHRIGVERIKQEGIDIGVISPYRAQVQFLRSLIGNDATLKPIRASISVNTVDGFQGRERDVIFISLVRANEYHQIGFLADLRRMNVAITRARCKLVILGNTDTLCRHPFYRRLHKYIDSLSTDNR